MPLPRVYFLCGRWRIRHILLCDPLQRALLGVYSYLTSLCHTAAVQPSSILVDVLSSCPHMQRHILARAPPHHHSTAWHFCTFSALPRALTCCARTRLRTFAHAAAALPRTLPLRTRTTTHVATTSHCTHLALHAPASARTHTRALHTFHACWWHEYLSLPVSPTHHLPALIIHCARAFVPAILRGAHPK